MDREREFSDYVTARRAQLYRTACLLCGDPHRAEDIVQDALARLYANWPRVSRADNVEGYVRRILVNSHYSDRRRPWRRESAATSVDLPPLEPGMAPEDADVIWAAIRGRPPGQRKVIVLRHIWDRSVEETAADLGISPGTVKTQTRDGLAALRHVLAPDFDTSSSLQGEER
jgi:RNA polymerase sigma-70 factor (sigma-E family)